MPFETESISRVGGRQENEDACASRWLGNTGCWVVADGLGGHRGGETASTVAVQAVLSSFQSNPEFSAAALQRHLEAAHQAVLNAQKEDPRLAGMRTTIVVLLTDSSQALWAHVGDSRLYCFDAGRIAFRTKDHSVVQAMVSAGDLSPRGIRHHPDRNRLLRALGNTDGGFRPEIHAQPRMLYRGTTFLLCTDGFWEELNEGEMEIDLAKAESPGDWLGKMEARLLERITGESDNYSAVAVAFDSESAPVAPTPRLVEDEEMNSRLDRSWKTTVVLMGVAFIALAAAALGVWNWLAIRDVKAAEAQAQIKQSQLAVPAELSHLVNDMQLRLDRLCRDSTLNAVCEGKGKAGGQANQDHDTSPKSPEKDKKAKKDEQGSNP